MALFSRKKTEETKESAPGAEVKAPVQQNHGSAGNLAHVLQHARITEKSTMHNEMGSYVFNVADGASKREVAQAVKALYGVRPRMVRVVTVPKKVKRNMRTGKIGIRGGGKKAYVYLKKGDTINL